MAYNDEDLIDLRSEPSTDSSIADIILQTSLLDIADSTGHSIQPLKASITSQHQGKNNSTRPLRASITSQHQGKDDSTQPLRASITSQHQGKDSSTDNNTEGTPTSALAVENSPTEDKPNEPASPPKPATRHKYAWDKLISIAHNTTPITPDATRMLQLGLFRPGNRIPRRLAKPRPGSTTALFYRKEPPEHSGMSMPRHTSAAQIAQAGQEFHDDLQKATANIPAGAVTATQAWDLVLNKRCAEHQGGSVAPDAAVASASAPSSSPPVARGRAVSVAPGQGSSALAKFFPAYYFEDSPPGSPVVGGAATSLAAAAADDWWSMPWPA